MTPVDAALRMPKSAAANRLLQIAQQPYREVVEAGGVALPVVTLDEWAIAPWARAVSGATGVSVSGLVIPPPQAMARVLVAQSLQKKRNIDQPRQPSAAERVENFLNSSASKEAKRLVRHLASAPLSLPVMQLVQQAMLPEARQSHLAEVFLSGLLYQSRSHRNPDEIIYEFYEGVREELRRFVTEAEIVRVIYEVSLYIQSRIGEAGEFAAGLAIPAAGGAVKRIDPLCLRFATLSADILRQFGRYQETVAKLEGLAKSGQSEVETVTKLPKDEKREADRPPVKKSRRAAIVIGVNRYDDTNLPNLKNCVNNAEAVSDSLGKYGYEWRLMTGDYATHQSIIESLYDISGFSASESENNLLLFYFSGHSEPIDGKTYLFPRDVSLSNVAATGIPVTDIIESLSISSAKQKIIILDGYKYGDDLLPPDQSTTNLVLIKSARPDEKASDIGPANHSPFTYFLLRAMEGRADTANKGFMTAIDLFDFLRTSMAAWSARYGVLQTPTMFYSFPAVMIPLVDYPESYSIGDALAGHAMPEEVRALTKEFATLSAIQVWSMMRKEGIYWEGSRFIVKGSAL